MLYEHQFRITCSNTQFSAHFQNFFVPKGLFTCDNTICTGNFRSPDLCTSLTVASYSFSPKGAIFLKKNGHQPIKNRAENFCVLLNFTNFVRLCELNYRFSLFVSFLFNFRCLWKQNCFRF